jgi:hypothetical protein
VIAYEQARAPILLGCISGNIIAIKDNASSGSAGKAMESFRGHATSHVQVFKLHSHCPPDIFARLGIEQVMGKTTAKDPKSIVFGGERQRGPCARTQNFLVVGRLFGSAWAVYS